MCTYLCILMLELLPRRDRVRACFNLAPHCVEDFCKLSLTVDGGSEALLSERTMHSSVAGECCGVRGLQQLPRLMTKAQRGTSNLSLARITTTITIF